MSLDFGVPQGSVLVALYTIPLTRHIKKRSVRHEIFADGAQLNQSENYSDLVHSLQDSVKDTGLWMEKKEKTQTE